MAERRGMASGHEHRMTCGDGGRGGAGQRGGRAHVIVAVPQVDRDRDLVQPETPRPRVQRQLINQPACPRADHRLGQVRDDQRPQCRVRQHIRRKRQAHVLPRGRPPRPSQRPDRHAEQQRRDRLHQPWRWPCQPVEHPVAHGHRAPLLWPADRRHAADHQSRRHPLRDQRRARQRVAPSGRQAEDREPVQAETVSDAEHICGEVSKPAARLPVRQPETGTVHRDQPDTGQRGRAPREQYRRVKPRTGHEMKVKARHA
jgi:hypothetical protein